MNRAAGCRSKRGLDWASHLNIGDFGKEAAVNYHWAWPFTCIACQNSWLDIQNCGISRERPAQTPLSLMTYMTQCSSSTLRLGIIQ